MACLAFLPLTSYIRQMKSLTVRLPDNLVGEIEKESRTRGLSKSDVVRERLTRDVQPDVRASGLLADVIGAAKGLPSDLSTRKKHYLKATGYGRNRR